MRKKVEAEPAREIPIWFVTYTDVITLLMTFFVLLMTFATDERENFARLQTSMFGPGGALGIAGAKVGAVDNDAILMRQRPNSARLTTRGSEMPPIHSDPAHGSLSMGLAGLEDAEMDDLSETHSIVVPLTLFIDRSDNLTAMGHQYLRMFARQLRNLPIDVTFHVGKERDVSKALILAQHLIKKEAIRPGRIGVGLQDDSGRASQSVKVVLTRHLEGSN